MMAATHSQQPLSVEVEKDNIQRLEHSSTRSLPNETTEKRVPGLDVAIVHKKGPVVHEKMNGRLLITLVCMSFLWIGSQIPLYLFGGVLPLMYQDIGHYDRYVWFVIAYLIPVAALCPFVGALSDLFGRQKVAIVGQLLLILGPIITSTAKTMNIAIAGSVFSGLGAGLNELIALTGTAEIVPVKARGKYVGAVVMTILPFTPSVLYAQLISKDSSWRYNGILIGVWNFIGLLLVIIFYRDPSRLSHEYTAFHVLSKIDYLGAFLSIAGVTLFMMGLQWGASQYPWGSTHNVVPLVLGIILIIAFFIWEFFAPHPMVPRAIFSKAKKTMIVILLITCLSGANFFVLLLIYPTQIYNVYGDDPLGVGERALPIGLGIIAGAVVCLVLIPVTKGRIRMLMVFFTALMTAGTGAMAIGNPDNIATMYGVVTVAALGIGGVIIPCSIIAQIACPDELIATVTAITLSIRYVGGAIGFAIYDNLVFRHATEALTKDVAYNTLALKAIVNPFAPGGKETIVGITQLMGSAQFNAVRHILATSPAVLNRDAFPIILRATQEAFATAYTWPYYVSIAFGAVCLILSLFVGDITHLMDGHIAHPAHGV